MGKRIRYFKWNGIDRCYYNRLLLKRFPVDLRNTVSGVRHDSGDPFEWGEKMIRHYESLGIDPKTKTLLFSDSLDFERADKIASYFAGKVKIAFGIGTYISNDTDVPALNIVMKTTKCNGMDVAKISDTPGKGMCKIRNMWNIFRDVSAGEWKTTDKKKGVGVCRTIQEKLGYSIIYRSDRGMWGVM